MTPEQEMLIAASEWQQPVAVCLALFMFSMGFIAGNSVNA